MLLSTEGLTLGYKGRAVVEGVRLELAPGELLAVIGHNGSGKSTLNKALLGLLSPLAGKIAWPNGKPDPIAFLGQRTSFDERFPLRLYDLVAMGAWHGLGWTGRLDANRKRAIDHALTRTNLTKLVDHALHELSGGQLQRALFARTMVIDAQLIILDEPFSAIDQTTEADLLALIEEWKAEGRAVIIVLHDLSAALRLADRGLLLGNGQARFGTPQQVFSRANLVEQGYLSAQHADWLGKVVA